MRYRNCHLRELYAINQAHPVFVKKNPEKEKKKKEKK